MKPVALAIRNADMQGDRIFELCDDGPVDQAPYTPWARVRELGRDAGMELMTADQVFARGVNPHDVRVISYDWPPATDALVAAGAHLQLLTSLEPPVIAWELYYHLKRISARFPHTMLFDGGRRRAATSTRFHSLYFPQVRTARRFDWSEWLRRKFLVSITSNKALVRSLTRFFDSPREVSLKREFATRLYPPIARDLYLERLRLAAYFGKRTDFDLFGQGWQRRHPAVRQTLHARVLRAYRGPVAEKLETLSRYRFSLCLENSIFEGYVSEKIFDCFFTGTIPIYLGAPDIGRLIPKETFIDLRDFRTYAELERSLDSMDQVAMRRYVDAAQDFLGSAGYAPFTAECFARQIVEQLTT
jgi:alpha(1,3/1,4) fucosyltransferase